MNSINPTIRERFLKPPLTKITFLASFCDPIDPKKFDFSQISMANPPYSFVGSKQPKNGFLQHFCRQQDKNSDPKMRFFGLFWAKMTKIGIPNPKLDVTNDYQQQSLYYVTLVSVLGLHFEVSFLPELHLGRARIVGEQCWCWVLVLASYQNPTPTLQVVL